MLVLSRKPDQQIQIGDEITVTILDVRGDRVSVGLTAPREMQIFRPEAATRRRIGGLTERGGTDAPFFPIAR